MARIWTCSDFVLFLLDNVFACFIVAPLVVAYWRGTWVLISYYLERNNQAINAWSCFVIGNMGWLILALLQEPLKRHIVKDNWLSWLVGYHVYTYIAAFCSVCLWRGLWVVMDTYI